MGGISLCAMGLLRKAYASMFERGKWKILRGDKVMVTAGKDRGQVGTVTKVIRDEKYPRVLVEGLNLVSLPAPTSCQFT